jgi:hypothetical protein
MDAYEEMMMRGARYKCGGMKSNTRIKMRKMTKLEYDAEYKDIQKLSKKSASGQSDTETILIDRET